MSGILHVEMRMEGASSSMRSASPLLGDKCTAGEREREKYRVDNVYQSTHC